MTNQNINPELIELTIKVVREYFYNEDNCYGVYLVYDLNSKTTDIDVLEWEHVESYSTTTITGNFQRLLIGGEYKCSCFKTYHKKFGQQYQVHLIKSTNPNSADEERAFIQFLVSDLQFKNILTVYPSPVTAILNGTFDYKKVKGFGQKNYILLKTKVEANFNNMKAMSVLGGYGLKFNIIKKLVETYGSADLAIQETLNNPYILYTKVDGVGFKRADQIAQAIGFDFYSPKRIMAGIMYSLEQQEQAGNTWGSIDVVKQNAEEVLELNIENMDEFLDSPDFYVDKENDRIALYRTWKCEKDITEELYRLHDAETEPMFSDEEVEQNINEIEQELGITYTDEQKKLFYEVNRDNVVVLTGAAGCGKTTLLNGCLKMLNKKINYITLVSPTARAAQVLEKSTGRKAGTIHRTLGSRDGYFEHNKDNPLPTQLLVGDESSMVDCFLFRSLLNALLTGCKLILVGDFAQLEAISVGNILNDIIESGVFPVVKLDKVFRQALDSGSLSAATDVRCGQRFYDSDSESLELGKDRDFRLWLGTKEDTSKRIAMVYKACLKKWSVNDLLVLAPMKKGNSGTHNLNNILQELANAQDGTKNQIELGTRVFREFDKVMHIKNDYNAPILDENLCETGLVGIFNGDVGYIKKIIPEEKLMYVDYDSKIIEYHSGNFDQIQLNYACTVHKSQGGQSPVVIMGLDISGYMNLKRSLVYTGMTRCSKQLFLIAERRALDMAIKNDSLTKKRSFLKDLLINYNLLDN